MRWGGVAPQPGGGGVAYGSNWQREIEAVACLKDGALSGGIVVAPLLHIAQLPHPRAGLIERLHCAESDVHLIPVVLHHLCQIVHISVVVCWCQVVCTPHIATANMCTVQLRYAALIDSVLVAGRLIAIRQQ